MAEEPREPAEAGGDAMKHVVEFLIALSIVIAVFALTRSFERDDTDPPGLGERSGMRLFTDHRTGCQYLSAGPIGGITPRLDRDGRHVGCAR